MVTEGIGGDVGMSGVRLPRGERRLPMVILLGERTVALVLLLKRSTTPALVVRVMPALGGEELERMLERADDCCC